MFVREAAMLPWVSGTACMASGITKFSVKCGSMSGACGDPPVHLGSAGGAGGVEEERQVRGAG